MRCFKGWSTLLFFLAIAPALAQVKPVEENVTYGYAQVLRASPVYQNLRVRVPEQRCEPTAGESGAAAAGSGAAPSIRCRTVQVERDERRLAGYDVEYQYKGERYMSRLETDPGSRLRIRIAITPDDLGSR